MPDITISLTAAAATRLQDAFEESLNLTDEDGNPRAATLQDAKDYIVADLKQFVKNSERRVAVKAAQAGATDPNIS
jgi:hypothetical protein